MTQQATVWIFRRAYSHAGPKGRISWGINEQIDAEVARIQHVNIQRLVQEGILERFA